MEIVLVCVGFIFGHFFSWQMNIAITAASLILGVLLWQNARKHYSPEAFIDLNVVVATGLFLVSLWAAHFLSAPAIQMFLWLLGLFMGLIPPSLQEFMLK